MVSTRRSFLAGFAWCAVLAALLWFIAYAESPISFVLGMQHAMLQEERYVLYHVDHAVVTIDIRAAQKKEPLARDPVLEPGDIVVILQRRVNA